jgi:transcriptional regulator with XRE-family HTH domain
VSHRARTEAQHDTAVDRHVGQRIREARKALGWTQDRLSEELRVDATVVGRYERGAIRLSVSRLLEVSRVLHRPINFFTDGAPEIICRE